MGSVRIVICPEAFPGALTATQAAEAMAAGWLSTAPQDTITKAPLSHGGPGFVGVIADAVPCVTLNVIVDDPLGRPVPAVIAIHEQDGVRTAYIESAQAAGLHLLEASERNPMVTTSRGVGQLMAAALDEGVDRIVVGVDELASHDGGAGALAVLGCGPDDSLGRGAAALLDVKRHQVTGLSETRERLSGVELVIATDDDTPLLGLIGTSATQAEARGASPEQAQQLEACLGSYADALSAALPDSQDLLTGGPRRWDREPSSGAGGGLGYALYALGGYRRSAIGICLDLWEFERMLTQGELVITGRGLVDGWALGHSAIGYVARAAEGFGLPTVVVAAEVLVGRRDMMGLGVCGTYAMADNPAQVGRFMLDPVGKLSHRVARLAKTWSTSGS